MLFKNTVASIGGLAGLAFAGPVVLAPRQNLCPAPVYVSTQVAPYVVVINQYFEDNTIINVGGITININNAPTSLVTTVTATTTQTVTSSVTVGATTVPTPFVLQVTVINARKRQAGTPLYIGSGGTEVDACGDATVWSLTNGQLTSNGEFVTAPSSGNSINFAVSGTTGISGTFSDLGGNVEWTDVSFFGGSAVFCSASNIVTANFLQATDDCSEVSLNIVPASSCASSSSSTTSASGSGTASATGSATASTTASNSGISGSTTSTATSSSTTASISDSSTSASTTASGSSSTSGTASAPSTSPSIISCPGANQIPNLAGTGCVCSTTTTANTSIGGSLICSVNGLLCGLTNELLQDDGTCVCAPGSTNTTTAATGSTLGVVSCTLDSIICTVANSVLGADGTCQCADGYTGGADVLGGLVCSLTSNVCALANQVLGADGTCVCGAGFDTAGSAAAGDLVCSVAGVVCALANQVLTAGKCQCAAGATPAVDLLGNLTCSLTAVLCSLTNGQILGSGGACECTTGFTPSSVAGVLICTPAALTPIISMLL